MAASGMIAFFLLPWKYSRRWKGYDGYEHWLKWLEWAFHGRVFGRFVVFFHAK